MGIFSVNAEEAHLYTWVDQDDVPFIQYYIDKYGAEPKTSVFEDEDEAFAKLRAGYSADVYGPCSYEIPRWRDAGLIQPIDVSKIEHWEKIPASLRNMPGVYDKNQLNKELSILLVTSAKHSLRMSLALEKKGFKVKKYIFNNKYIINFNSFLPDARTININNASLYEYIGIIFYFLKGYI